MYSCKPNIYHLWRPRFDKLREQQGSSERNRELSSWDLRATIHRDDYSTEIPPYHRPGWQDTGRGLRRHYSRKEESDSIRILPVIQLVKALTMKYQREALLLVLAIVLASINVVLVRHWIIYDAKSYVLPLWQYVLTALGCFIVIGYIGYLIVLWFKPHTFWRLFFGLTLTNAIAFTASAVTLDYLAGGFALLGSQPMFVITAGPLLYSPIVAPFTALTSFLLLKCKWHNNNNEA